MHKVGEHLKYFIAKRVSEDSAWRDVQIIFSGSDVPGEGEHKIMEFIRLNKAKPGYNPNVRHCLYGLDADLILLGLLSHDPHFALLREEVSFGRGASQAKVKSAAETKFFLMHLCLMREYLELEFKDLLNTMPESDDSQHRKYSLGSVIDDFILVMCFVGNDFLPSLPNFHLGEGVLDTLFRSYKLCLPIMGGSINQNGHVVFHRLAILFKELCKVEDQTLKSIHPSLFSEDTITADAKKIKALSHQLIESFLERTDVHFWQSPKQPRLKISEIKFLRNFATEFNFMLNVDSATGVVTLEKSLNMNRQAAFQNSLERFKQELSRDPIEEKETVRREWKRQYYLEKLGLDTDEQNQQKQKGREKKLDALLQSYCEGLQWNMYYYYQGVASWSWFYPHHYAPHISDLAEFAQDFVCDPFDLSQPLLPLEQLMAVLPPSSCKLVPPKLAKLMVSEESPVKDFYPAQFRTDLNGKRNSWEAIVLIPFIEDEKLLPLVRSQYCHLSPLEIERNKFGSSHSFFYATTEKFFKSPSSSLPDLTNCKTRMVDYELPILQPNERFVAALCRGALVGIHAMPGFPTLATVPFSSSLDSEVGLDVFGQAAKGLTMVLTLSEAGEFKGQTVLGVANKLIDSRVYFNWPHLMEGKVSSLCDGCLKYERSSNGVVETRMVSPEEFTDFGRICEKISRSYKKQHAVILESIHVLVWIKPFSGMLMLADGSTIKQFSEALHPYALQTIVAKRFNQEGLEVEDSRYEERSAYDVPTLFPIGSSVVYLGPDYYGAVAKVTANKVSPTAKTPAVEVQLPLKITEPKFPTKLAQEGLKQYNNSFFIPANEVCRIVGISSLLLSKITSSLTLFLKGEIVRSSSIGLNIKSEAKGQCAFGLARKRVSWEFAPKVIQLLIELKGKFSAIFKNLEQEKSSPNIDAEKIFPQVPEMTKETLNELVAPIKEMIKSRLGGNEFMPIDSVYLLKDVVAYLEKTWDEYASHQHQPKTRKVTLPPSLLLCAATAAPRLMSHKQVFSLGERVVYVGPGCTIPFGISGIIISKDSENLRILLDAPVIGGCSFNGLCTEGRGIEVSVNDCLNITNAQLPLGVEDIFKRLSLGEKMPDRNHEKSLAKEYDKISTKTLDRPLPKETNTPPSHYYSSSSALSPPSAVPPGAVSIKIESLFDSVTSPASKATRPPPIAKVESSAFPVKPESLHLNLPPPPPTTLQILTANQAKRDDKAAGDKNRVVYSTKSAERDEPGKRILRPDLSWTARSDPTGK